MPQQGVPRRLIHCHGIRDGKCDSSVTLPIMKYTAVMTASATKEQGVRAVW
jgi:hypothetical protein